MSTPTYISRSSIQCQKPFSARNFAAAHNSVRHGSWFFSCTRGTEGDQLQSPLILKIVARLIEGRKVQRLRKTQRNFLSNWSPFSTTGARNCPWNDFALLSPSFDLPFNIHIQCGPVSQTYTEIKGWRRVIYFCWNNTEKKITTPMLFFSQRFDVRART